MSANYICPKGNYTHKVRVSKDDLRDTLAGECLLPEPFLDVVQDLGMCGVILVQHILELKVGRTEAVAEVLREDPSTI